MARERSWAYRIATAFLAELKEIGHDETVWLTKPKAVVLGPSSLIAQAARPALALDIGADGTREEMLSGVDQHAESVVLEITVVSEDPADQVGALQDLIADVRRCVRQNEALSVAGVGDVTLRDLGWVRASVQGLQGTAGIGSAVVLARAFYESGEEDP